MAEARAALSSLWAEMKSPPSARPARARARAWNRKHKKASTFFAFFCCQLFNTIIWLRLSRHGVAVGSGHLARIVKDRYGGLGVASCEEINVGTLITKVAPLHSFPWNLTPRLLKPTAPRVTSLLYCRVGVGDFNSLLMVP